MGDEEAPDSLQPGSAVDFILGRLNDAERILRERGQLDPTLEAGIRESRQTLGSLDLGPLPEYVAQIHDAESFEQAAAQVAQDLGESESDGLRVLGAGLKKLQTRSVAISVDAIIVEAALVLPRIEASGSLATAPAAVSGQGTITVPARAAELQREQRIIAAGALLAVFFAGAAILGYWDTVGDAWWAIGFAIGFLRWAAKK